MAMTYSPHSPCLQGDQFPFLIGLHVGADIAICVCYLLMPAAAIVVVMRALNSPSYRNFLYKNACKLGTLPLGFVLAIGTGHALNAVTFYYPIYWAEAIWNVLTALISLATLILLGGLGIHDPDA
jgi:hypothetical protein